MRPYGVPHVVSAGRKAQRRGQDPSLQKQITGRPLDRTVCRFRLFPVACQKLAGAFLFGVVDEILCAALLYHNAAVHKKDAVRHIAGKLHLMGDDDHGGAVRGKLPQDAQHLTGQLGVKGRGRLIKAENVGVQRQGAGDGPPESWCG